MGKHFLYLLEKRFKHRITETKTLKFTQKLIQYRNRKKKGEYYEKI